MLWSEYVKILKSHLSNLKAHNLYNEAHQLLDSINPKTDEELAFIYREKILLYRYEYNLEEAVLYCEKLSILHPDNVTNLFLHALTIVELKRFNEAIPILSKVIKYSILQDNPYFIESGYALRLWCCIHLNNFKYTNQDLKYLSDDFILYLSDGVSITKADIVCKIS